MNNKSKDIFVQGAEDGAVMGALLVAMFILFVLSSSSSLVSLLFFATLFMPPVMLYRKMRAAYVGSGGMLTFSAVWLEGIVTMMCGTLLLMCAMFIYFRWIDPTFWVDMISANEAAVKAAGLDNPSVNDMLAQMRAAVDAGLLKPISVAMSAGWLASGSGCLMALLFTPFVRHS